ncbi:MAG: UDP-N-acetylmuramoyl-L-alanyl-D-glutamate--2,6-diaminopimelate ligase [Acidimicrobiales bacterium]|nr:UDP-N-acetylmuramoyl-L-alanyl-D-glutamate--2,6-diaminopimelate ligase [Acidimicrobiales bacterium]
MRLAALLATSELKPVEMSLLHDPEVLRVSHDSRTVVPGDLFCCVPGATHDGHRFASEAVAAGAVALLVESPIAGQFVGEAREIGAIPVVLVPSVRSAMSVLAAASHGWPSRFIDLVGVTGTNGKTSVVHLLRGILQASGRRSESWGTLSGPRTTPEGPDLQNIIAGWVAGGVEAAAMEVSSHALAQDRVGGTKFSAVGFTTLGRDHLDFHGSMEAYEAAKARLFDGGFADHAVVSVASPAGERMATLAEASGMSVVRVDPTTADATVSPTGSSLVWRGRPVVLSAGGRFAVANALLAAELALVLGCGEDDVAAGLSTVGPVPGRFEFVSLDGGPIVIVDYAHTPDALVALLAAAREVLESQATANEASAGLAENVKSPEGRLLIVFGCGGERDSGKRPLMGRVVDKAADLVFVTSDNPRGEPPEQVIADILTGMERTDMFVEVDRRCAIAAALASAGPADLLVVAGRGHESTQEVDGVLLPFDDRLVVAEEWRLLTSRDSSVCSGDGR